MNCKAAQRSSGNLLTRLITRKLGLALILMIFQCGLAFSALADTYVSIESEAGDYIGGGQTATFSTVTTSMGSNDSSVSFSAGGFNYQFEAPSGDLVAGLYEGATRYPFNDAGVAGLNVSGNGRGCNKLTGRFIVHEIELNPDNSLLTAAIDFEQHCEGGTPALFGFIRFESNIAIADEDGDGVTDIKDNCISVANADQTDTDGDGLGNVCDPVQGVTFVYLDSEVGDYIGQGQTWLFTVDNGGPITLSTSSNSTHVSVNAGGFTYDFDAPQSDFLNVGIYEGATRYPFNSGTEPGLNVSGNGRGCSQLTGRFEILEITQRIDGSISNFAADFEQHCEGGTAALFGIVRYNAEIAGAGDFDSDSDGVIDPADNCPDTFNADQANIDGDSLGDVCDPYPMDSDNLLACLSEADELLNTVDILVAENQMLTATVVSLEADNLALTNAVNALEAENLALANIVSTLEADNQALRDELVGFADSDGDGVPDVNDLCPGTKQSLTNSDGCSRKQK